MNTFINDSIIYNPFVSTSSIDPLIDAQEIPQSFKEMSDLSRNCVMAYIILFLMSGTGNISVFRSILKQLKHYPSRITLLILNLTIADLLVTFFAMPLEIVWRITIQWYGGDFLCKVCQFCRAFGFYLSSMVVICISLDRYFAIIYPMKLAWAERRVKISLVSAWIAAFIFASPQVVMFKVMPHPLYPSFHQCVTETFFHSKLIQELVYNVFSVSFLYFIPLVVIIFTYFRIVLKMHQKLRKSPVELKVSFVAVNPNCSIEIDEESMKTEVTQEPDLTKLATLTKQIDLTEESIIREETNQTEETDLMSYERSARDETTRKRNKSFIQKSNAGGLIMTRARNQTLRLSCLILLTFFFCWSPYVIMTLWYMVDREGAKGVDARLQEGFFIMAVSNSVINPLIHGTVGNVCTGPDQRRPNKARAYCESRNNRLRYRRRGLSLH